MAGTYLPVSIDLTLQGAQQLAPAGVPVESIAVLALPPGSVLTIQEKGGQPFPVPPEGKTLRFCPPLDGGVVVTVAPGQAGTAILVANLDLEGSSQPPEGAPIVYNRANQAGSVNAPPTIQLWNPVGSGRIIRVRDLAPSTGTNGRYGWVFSTQQLSNVGGGVLSAGVAAYLDRRIIKPIIGVIAGSTFDNSLQGSAGTGVIPVGLFDRTTQIVGGLLSSQLWTPGTYVYLLPGMGITVQHNQNGAGTIGDCVFVGEEL